MELNISFWYSVVFILIIGALSYAFLSFGLRVRSRRKHSKLLDTIAGTSNVRKSLLFGHVFIFGMDTPKGILNQAARPKTWPMMFNMWVGPFWSMLHLYHPESVGPILKSHPAVATKDHFVYKISYPWIGHGLVTSDGELWARHRKMLTPAFHFNLLKKYAIIFNSVSKVMIENGKDLQINLWRFTVQLAG